MTQPFCQVITSGQGRDQRISGHLGLAVMVKEIWFMKVSANSHSILEQLGYKPRTPHMRREKNEFVSQRSNIFSIMSIMHSSILQSLVELRSKSMLICSYLVEFSLLIICLCINNKLLEQLPTIEERWLRIISDMKVIGIVVYIRYYL